MVSGDEWAARHAAQQHTRKRSRLTTAEQNVKTVGRAVKTVRRRCPKARTEACVLEDGRSPLLVKKKKMLLKK